MPPPSGLVKPPFCCADLDLAALLLLVLAVWSFITARVVLGTPQGIVLALRVVGAVLPVDIQVQGPTGRLNERFGLQRLTIEFGRAHVLIDDLRAQFRRLGASSAAIRLAMLSAARVQVHIDPGGASAPPPSQISLPATAGGCRLDVEAFELLAGIPREAPSLRASSIHAGLDASPTGTASRRAADHCQRQRRTGRTLGGDAVSAASSGKSIPIRRPGRRG